MRVLSMKSHCKENENSKCFLIIFALQHHVKLHVFWFKSFSFWHLQVQTAFSFPRAFYSLTHGGLFWRRLLLIGIAVVAIILGHEMACLASDAVSLLVY